LIQCIQKIKNGERVFPLLEVKDISEKAKLPLSNTNSPQHKLTGRELEIIGLIAKGLTSRQIADKLFLSEFTINTHRRNIMRKLDFKNVAGLINFARENHLL
jgi:DNA-binding NarL/FixJ family response regulator